MILTNEQVTAVTPLLKAAMALGVRVELQVNADTCVLYYPSSKQIRVENYNGLVEIYASIEYLERTYAADALGKKVATYIGLIQEWVEAGFPKHPKFRKDFGICANIYQIDTSPAIKDYLIRECFNGDAYPFDNGSGKYFHSYDDKYANPERLAWLKENAK